MRNGDIGAKVAALQRNLNATGFAVTVNAVFDEETEAAVIALQKRAGLVADGIVGPKTLTIIATGNRNQKLLSEANLASAATRLGIELAALKAVNLVESNGHGFLPDGRPVILYERHVAYRLLAEDDLSPETFWENTPNILNPKRGGYTGGSGEWSRLALASQIMAKETAQAACSWGQFQIMGYHWEALGYPNISAFVAAMCMSEAEQLDAFARFIEADPALHKALKARKWAEFARRYNGPAYRENDYDIKLARAYDKFSPKVAA